MGNNEFMDNKTFIDGLIESSKQEFSKAKERLNICCVCQKEDPHDNHFFPHSYMKRFFQANDKDIKHCIQTVHYMTNKISFSKANLYRATCGSCDKIFNESDTKFMETFKGKVELFVKAYCFLYFSSTMFLKSDNAEVEIPLFNLLTGLYSTLSRVNKHPDLLKTKNINTPVNGFYLSLISIDKKNVMILIIAPKDDSTVMISLPVSLSQNKSVNYLYLQNCHYEKFIRAQNYNKIKFLDVVVRYYSFLSIESISMTKFREKMNNTNPMLKRQLKNITKEDYYKDKNMTKKRNDDRKKELILKNNWDKLSKTQRNKKVKGSFDEIKLTDLRNPSLLENVIMLYDMVRKIDNLRGA